MIDPVERAAREMRNQAKVVAVVMWAAFALNWADPHAFIVSRGASKALTSFSSTAWPPRVGYMTLPR